ncbi:uncharacterized protein LOC104423315 [Eucalyptus grandis]|uniref:uncharacterized protein LOC104423315 n=1 Tax=Eucalyptus grandis TaxID=71139 RepID=UPI000524D5C8|nr:uncharacterized protein LOC104423315 [Eucalyptus grandis]
MATGRVKLKLLVDRSSQRVLFAEGGKDFVDFLFHILVLPVGTVIRLLEKTGMEGSLGNLYSSVEKLNDEYIAYSKKDILLKPKAPAFLSAIQFKLPETSTIDSTPKTSNRFSSESAAGSDYKGGFVQGVVTYMVMDDLTVMPMSNISSITLLNRFNVKEIGHLEEKVISLGMDEGVKLLRASLNSKKVLTDAFLREK